MICLLGSRIGRSREWMKLFDRGAALSGEQPLDESEGLVSTRQSLQRSGGATDGAPTATAGAGDGT